MEGCLRLMADCRTHGTHGRLKSVLHRFAEELLPENAHNLCSGKAFISITRLYPLGNELVSEFESREDLIRALLVSCHVPLWFDRQLWVNYKECRCMDGGLTSLIPVPPVKWPIRVSCFPVHRWGKRFGARIAPDCYRPTPYTIPQLLRMSLIPAEDRQLLGLYENGRRDAQDYVNHYARPMFETTPRQN